MLQKPPLTTMGIDHGVLGYSIAGQRRRRGVIWYYSGIYMAAEMQTNGDEAGGGVLGGQWEGSRVKTGSAAWAISFSSCIWWPKCKTTRKNRGRSVRRAMGGFIRENLVSGMVRDMVRGSGPVSNGDIARKKERSRSATAREVWDRAVEEGGV